MASNLTFSSLDPLQVIRACFDDSVNALRTRGIVTPHGLNEALKASVVTVTSTPTSFPVTPLVNRNGLTVRIIGSSTVFIGGPTVTYLTGYPRYQNEEIAMDITDDPDIAPYFVCAPGETCEIRLLEVA
jgi:hypothetical protein